MSIADNAKQVYEGLREKLEAKYQDQYVAIEPESKSYFLGASFIEAAMAAKNEFPDRKSFVLRIGHEAAFHIGASTS
ncbi:MAG: hypothetical protein GXP24_09785 [Planctomycetes bacterium]|nr:hypothetical protein [Planctomycetota bacterium]